MCWQPCQLLAPPSASAPLKALSTASIADSPRHTRQLYKSCLSGTDSGLWRCTKQIRNQLGRFPAFVAFGWVSPILVRTQVRGWEETSREGSLFSCVQTVGNSDEADCFVCVGSHFPQNPLRGFLRPSVWVMRTSPLTLTYSSCTNFCNFREWV